MRKKTHSFPKENECVAAALHSYCTDIPWSEAQPSDLVFNPDDSHVGIVGGTDADGNLLIVHCSGGTYGVVIASAVGFIVERPEWFHESTTPNKRKTG